MQAFHSIAKCVAALAMSCQTDGESAVNQFVKDIQVQLVNSCEMKLPLSCTFFSFSKMEHFPTWCLSDEQNYVSDFLATTSEPLEGTTFDVSR